MPARVSSSRMGMSMISGYIRSPDSIVRLGRFEVRGSGFEVVRGTRCCSTPPVRASTLLRTGSERVRMGHPEFCRKEKCGILLPQGGIRMTFDLPVVMDEVCGTISPKRSLGGAPAACYGCYESLTVFDFGGSRFCGTSASLGA